MATLTLPRTIARSTTAALLAGIAAGGLAIRLYAIGAKSLWIDESFSIWMATQPLGALWGYTVQLDQHPPLYYTLLHAWLALGDSEAVARGFSALWGVLTLPLIYLIGRRNGGQALGLLAALILAVSPLHISFAQDARMYTMLAFFAGMAILCMLHLLDTERPDPLAPIGAGDRAATAGGGGSTDRRIAAPRGWWVGFVLFTTLTMLGHNTAIFFPIAVALFIAGAIGLPALLRARGERSLANLWRWAIGLGAALLLWLP